MIAVIDPLWFHWPGGVDEPRFSRALDEINSTCTAYQIEVPEASDYWPTMWQALVRPLQARLRTPQAKGALKALEDRARKSTVGSPANTTGATISGKVWGFQDLFGPHNHLPGNDWPVRMATAVAKQVALGRQVVMFCRREAGRNVTAHRVGNVVIEEVTRWRLCVQAGPPGTTPVACVESRRQLDVPWSARFDPRLPAAADRARYPFCLPADWFKRSVPAVATHTSKPCFIDSRGNGWCRPNIPGGSGYHWDVFISHPPWNQAIGYRAINVVQFGAPRHEGTPGAIHHVPDGVQINDVGWKC